MFDRDPNKETRSVNTITAASKVTTVTDAKEDPRLLQNLDYPTWLPFAAKTYEISGDINDYILMVYPICPSDIPNRNGIGFPLHELTRFQPPPVSRMAYKAWTGVPLHYEHCFTGDTKVRTSKGLYNISALRVGDKVLTHKNRYRKVTKLFDNGIKQTYEINCVGLSRPIYATSNHPMWVVDRRQLMEGGQEGVQISTIRYRATNIEHIKPHFRPVSDIYPLDYLVVPLDIGGNIEADPAFAFLVGLYTAEGNLLPNNRAVGDFTSVSLTIAYNEKELMAKAVECCRLLTLECKTSHNKKAGTGSILIKDAKFAEAMYALVGSYSHKKRIKGELRKWDNESLKHFLGGYVSGDGCLKGPRVRCVTVSEDLAQDIQCIFGRLGIPASANGGGWATMFTSKYHTRKGELRKYKGGKPYREDNSRYCVGISKHEFLPLLPYVVGKKYFNFVPKRKEIGPCIIVRDNYLLLPISSITASTKDRVFNIEVEEDHTYVAGGVIAHNCNEVHTDAYGVVLDTSLHKISGYGGGKLWKVMGLIALDKTKYPEMAKRVLDGDIDTGSMGAYVDTFSCSYCNAPMTKTHCCNHIHHKNEIDWKEYKDYDGSSHIAFRNAHGISPIEYSLVESPAWVPSLSDHILMR